MTRIVVSLVFVVFLAATLTAQPQRGQTTRPGSASGKYYALIIGVQRYDDQKITALEYPVNDSKNFREALIRNFNFEDNNVIQLLDPDRETIIATLDTLSRQLNSNDNLLIFYAGHGYWDKDRDQGYWFPSDAQYSNRSKWISNGDLRDAVRAIKTRSTLLITDSCFSGSIFRTYRSAFRSEAEINNARKYTARIAITSGALNTVPDRSVFIKYLVKRLNDNTANYLLASDLFKQIETPVKSNGPSTPLYGVIQETGHEGGDFVFVRRNNSATPPPSPSLTTQNATPSNSTITQNTPYLPSFRPNNNASVKITPSPVLSSDPLIRAETLMRHSDYDAALNSAQSVLKANPDNIVAKRIIFESNFYRTMDRELISADITSIAQTQLSGNNAREYEALGLAIYYKSIDETAKKLTTQESTESIQVFNRAISLDPTLATAYFSRGLIFMQRRDYVSAISDFNQAITLDSNYAIALVMRGRAYFYKADYVQALQNLNRSLEIQPELAPTYVSRGMIYMQQSNPIAAIADFNQAIRIAPKYGTAYHQRAEYYYAQKQFDLAAQDFIEGIKLGSPFDFRVKHRHGFDGFISAEHLCNGILWISKETISFRSMDDTFGNHDFIAPLTNIKELSLSNESRVYMKVDVQEQKKIKSKKYDVYSPDADILKTAINKDKPMSETNTESKIMCNQSCVAKNILIFNVLKKTVSTKQIKGEK